MKRKVKRKYDNTSRAEAAAITERQILKATVDLWLEYPIHQMTLEMIAHQAGVTERTILRKFGSKEELFEAAIQADDIIGIQSIKDEAEAGNIEQIVRTLIKEYKYSGMASIRTLSVENELQVAAVILVKARRTHREWCERVFSPYLPVKSDKNYHVMIGALYAATDVHNWKLLHIDLGYTETETQSIFVFLIRSIVNNEGI